MLSTWQTQATPLSMQQSQTRVNKQAMKERPQSALAKGTAARQSPPLEDRYTLVPERTLTEQELYMLTSARGLTHATWKQAERGRKLDSRLDIGAGEALGHQALWAVETPPLAGSLPVSWLQARYVPAAHSIKPSLDVGWVQSTA